MHLVRALAPLSRQSDTVMLPLTSVQADTFVSTC